MIKTFAMCTCLLVMAAGNHCFAQGHHPETVYLIIDITIKDRELYAKYVELVPSIIKKYGGKYLTRGGKVTQIAGDWNPERIIIIEFKSMQMLQECFQSPEYKKIAPLREQATASRAIMANGIDQTEIW